MKKFLLLVVLVFCFFNLNAQKLPNPITTATPFLLIAPDARAGGMGDLGVATYADASSQHWNASKYAFLKNEFAIGVIYTPWLKELTNDVFLGGITFANRLNERSAWATSIKYFNLGDIELTDANGFPEGTEKLNEFSLDFSYALKLSKSYAMGVAIRYIRSDLGIKSANTNINPVNTFAVDISGYYQSEEANYGNFNGVWRAGFNISNLGSKVSYTDDDNSKNYLPTNLKIGTGFDFILDTENKVGVTLELNKLLVPTPSIPVSENSNKYAQKNVSFINGIFSSFADAPAGFSEELKEITWALGIEYLYRDSFALRTGYFHESDLKSGRKYLTLGSGFKFKNTSLDVSYLFNTSEIKNPLENTLRFSLSFDLGEVFDVY